MLEPMKKAHNRINIGFGGEITKRLACDEKEKGEVQTELRS